MPAWLDKPQTSTIGAYILGDSTGLGKNLTAGLSILHVSVP